MPIEEYRKNVAEQKRQAILDAAIENFLVIGYERTTLDMVAKSAGVSTATVYKHFSTKHALFGSIMERIWETGIAVVHTGDRPCTTRNINNPTVLATSQQRNKCLTHPPRA